MSYTNNVENSGYNPQYNPQPENTQLKRERVVDDIASQTINYPNEQEVEQLGNTKKYKAQVEFGPIDDREMSSNPPSIWEPLCQGQLDKVKELLNQGANVDERDEYGLPPLHWITSVHWYSVPRNFPSLEDFFSSVVPLVNFMLMKGANVNLRDKQSNTALMRAARNGVQNSELLQALINHGAKVNDEDESGDTALHFASLFPSFLGLKKVKTLVKCGADVHKHNKQGLTALGKLVSSTFENREEIGKYLINASLKQLPPEKKELLHLFGLYLLRTSLCKDVRMTIIKKAITVIRKEVYEENWYFTAKSLLKVHPYDDLYNLSLCKILPNISMNELQVKLYNYLGQLR